MSQLYNIYQSNTFLLAKSVIIKFSFVNDHINRELGYAGYPISSDPTTHKYYMNLAGEYHPSDHDKLLKETGNRYITVPVATDSGYETVPLTKELLHGDDGNVSLLNEYQLGNRFHRDLLRRYPEHESLIKGLLCPIDKQLAIEAKDGMILSIGYRNAVYEEGVLFYRQVQDLVGTRVSQLIEPQEGNLIIKLQEYIDKTLFRWFNGGYSLTDDLYVPYFLGILYSQLPAKIMNIRLGNTHTGQVHKFHVREYLESHGVLGRHVDVIPFEQIMYLYRNMRFLETNMGKTFTFNELIKNILTPLGIPIAGYTFNHDVTLMDGVTNLLPEARLNREHLNFKSIGASSDDKTVRAMLDKQVPIARENWMFLKDIDREITEDMIWGGDDNLVTKILESELFEVADPTPVEFTSMAVWLWGYTASRGWYKGTVFVSNPVSDERISLTPLNAFILAIYCLNKGATNTTLEEVPNGRVEVHYITSSPDEARVPLTGGFSPRPTAQALWDNPLFEGKIKLKEVESMIGDEVVDYNSSNPKDFYRKAKKHHNLLSRRFFDVARVEDLYRRGYMEHVYKRLYWHSVPLTLTKEPMLYTQFFRMIGLDLTGFTQIDYYTLFERLVKACVADSDEYEFSLKEIQKSAIEILRHFSSYTTHFIYSINENEVANASNKYPRISNADIADAVGSIEGGLYIDLDILDVDATGEIEADVGVGTLEIVDHGIDEIVIYGGRIDFAPEISGLTLEREDKATFYDVDILDARPVGDLLPDEEEDDGILSWDRETWRGKTPPPPPPPPPPPEPFDPNSVSDTIQIAVSDVTVTTESFEITDKSESDQIQIRVSDVTVSTSEIQTHDRAYSDGISIRVSDITFQHVGVNVVDESHESA